MSLSEDNPKPIYWYTCLFNHKWSKWTQQNLNYTKVIDGKAYEGIETIETKHCLRCNKMKINKLHN